MPSVPQTELLPWCQWEWCAYDQLNYSIQTMGPGLGAFFVASSVVLLQVWFRSRKPGPKQGRVAFMIVPIALLVGATGVGVVLRDPSLINLFLPAMLILGAYDAVKAKRGGYDYLMDGYEGDVFADDPGDERDGGDDE